MELFEAFNALNKLDEDTFNLDTEGVKKLQEFEDEDYKDELSVYDLSAEDEEDLKDEDYMGKVILDCCVCHSKLFKDKDEVELNEDETMANEGEECPFCFSPDGYKVIGEIKEFEAEDEDKDDLEDKETESEDEEIEIEDEEEVIEEGCHKNSKKKSLKEKRETLSDKIDALLKDDSLTEGKEIGNELGEYQKWVDYDMKRYGKISDKTKNKIKESGLEIIKDDHGDYEVIAKEDKEHLKEDFKDVSITTDNEHMEMTSDEDGKVTITTEPVKEEVEEIVMEPVKEETKEEIKRENEPEDEEVDMDIEEFDEESFDELGESYFTENYSNVKGYKTNKVSQKGNNIFVEGIITFDSGNKKKTNFVFESYKYNKKANTFNFKGMNKEITPNSKPFMLEGKITKGKKLITESFTKK